MNQFGRVAAYLSSPYWCVYSALLRMLLVCIRNCLIAKYSSCGRRKKNMGVKLTNSHCCAYYRF